MVRWAAYAALGGACLAGGEVGAAAQGDGVVVDPETPAGKEYALPLEAARRDASGAVGGNTGSQSAPLFGAGISRRAESRTGGGSDRGSRSREDRGRKDAPSSDARGSSPAAAAVPEDGTGLSAGLLTALIALGVFMLGGIVGLSVRTLRATEQPR